MSLQNRTFEETKGLHSFNLGSYDLLVDTVNRTISLVTIKRSPPFSDSYTKHLKLIIENE